QPVDLSRCHAHPGNARNCEHLRTKIRHIWNHPRSELYTGLANWRTRPRRVRPQTHPHALRLGVSVHSFSKSRIDLSYLEVAGRSERHGDPPWADKWICTVRNKPRLRHCVITQAGAERAIDGARGCPYHERARAT